MSKAAVILERAMLKLAEASKAEREKDTFQGMVRMLAQRIEENETEFFHDPVINCTVTVGFKASIIH